jgi:pimeloyl-ACP methyl ester carboxylesterase
MDKIQPQFFLYTPENTDGQTIDYNNLNSSIQAVTINNKRPFFVEIHGYGESWPKQWLFDMKDSLVALGNNVLIVRWTTGSKGPDYFKASANTQTTGAAVALLVNNMIQQNKVDLSITTIVGFSLGAHVAGYAGDALPGLRRIIGLDPAGPMFACQNTATRLDPTDAKFVQAIHTNGDNFFYGGAGTLEQMGDIDFYANGGQIQAGCERGVPQVVHDILHLNFSSMEDDLSCSHDRSHELFTESVKDAANPSTSCNFMAFPCTSSDVWTAGQCFQCASNGCPTFGYTTDIGTPYSGKYYFNTQSDNVLSGEYCGSQYLVSVSSDVDAKGNITITLFGPNGHSNPYAFQTDEDTLAANIPEQKVAVTPWNTKSVNQMQLVYNRYTSLIHKDGTKSWTLTASSILATNEKKVNDISGNLVIGDNVTVTIPYQ